MSVALTEASIRSAIKRAREGKVRVELIDAHASGMRLRVTADGRASWSLACRDAEGAMRRFKLGDYPAVGIGEARTLARDQRTDVRRGADPIAEKKKKATAARAKAEEDRLTVGVLVGEWEAKHLVRRSARYRGEAVRALKSALSKQWEQPAVDLDRAGVRKALDALGRRSGSKGMVLDRSAIQRRTAAYGSACWSWAVEREHLKVNPFLNLPLPEAAASRDRVLTDAELTEVLRAAGIKTTYGRIIRLLATTGQRASEVGGIRWEEVSEDRATWTLPAARAKNGKAHVVPLSNAAQAALSGLKPLESGKGLVFPSAHDTPFCRWSECKPALDLAIQKTRLEALGQGRAAMPNWRVHDLRRTLATGLEALGVRLEETEAVLNHVSGKRSGIAAVYQRHDYKTEKRKALDVWGAKVEALVEGKPVVDGAMIVQMWRAG